MSFLIFIFIFMNLSIVLPFQRLTSAPSRSLPGISLSWRSCQRPWRNTGPLSCFWCRASPQQAPCSPLRGSAHSAASKTVPFLCCRSHVCQSSLSRLSLFSMGSRFPVNLFRSLLSTASSSLRSCSPKLPLIQSAHRRLPLPLTPFPYSSFILLPIQYSSLPFQCPYNISLLS